MTADKSSPLVPKLRFPEFRSRRGWPYTTLSAVLEEHGVKSDGTSEVHSVSLSKGIVPQVEHMGRSFAASDTAHYSLVRPFDVVYTRSPLAIFKLGIVKQHKGVHNAIVSPLYGVFAPRNQGLGLIIEAYFDSPSRSIRLLDPLAQKGAKNTIQLSNGRFLSGALHLPEDEDEQQKIADCLDSLDDLIAAVDRNLEALRQHKQGLMQRLFPLPGETVPRLRFPEFRDAGEWEETTIGNMGEVITGSTPSTLRRDFYGGDFLFVSPADISDLRFVERTKTTLTEAGFAECRPIRENSVLFVCIGSTIGKVAQCSRPCATNQQINSLVVNSAFVADFAYYLLDKESVRIARLAGKQAVPIINKSLFAAVEVTAPAAVEQRRIADCLSSLDARLAAQAEKLSALKQHKQGLLQQLFPSPEVE